MMRKRIKFFLFFSLIPILGCNGSIQKIQNNFQNRDGLIGGKQTAISTGIKDAVSDIPLLDDFQPNSEASLTSQPRSKDGGFIIHRPGLYEYNAQSYCLHAGTYAPGSGDGYVYAPLNGKRSSIIKNILKESANYPEIPQHEIQTLIWGILAHAKISDMPQGRQQIAKQLLTDEEIFELNGGAAGLIPDNLKSELKKQVPPEVFKVLEAEAKIREIVGRANANYKELEKIAVLTGEAPWGEGSRVVPKGRWSYHPDGYFIKMIPSGYQKTLVQVYVPEEFTVKRDPLNRIIAIEDRQVNGLQIVYRDSSENTPTVGLQVNEFKEVRLKNFSGNDKNVKYEQWTFVGRPDGEPRAEVLRVDAKERYREIDRFHVQISKIRTDLNTGANPEYLDEVLDLASLYHGFKAFKPESAKIMILKAWQYYFCRYNGKCNNKYIMLAFNETDRILPMFLAENGGGGTIISPSDSVATPGNTAKQRLAISDRSSDKEKKCEEKKKDLQGKANEMAKKATQANRKKFKEAVKQRSKIADEMLQKMSEANKKAENTKENITKSIAAEYKQKYKKISEDIKLLNKAIKVEAPHVEVGGTITPSGDFAHLCYIDGIGHPACYIFDEHVIFVSPNVVEGKGGVLEDSFTKNSATIMEHEVAHHQLCMADARACNNDKSHAYMEELNGVLNAIGYESLFGPTKDDAEIFGINPNYSPEESDCE